MILVEVGEAVVEQHRRVQIIGDGEIYGADGRLVGFIFHPFRVDAILAGDEMLLPFGRGSVRAVGRFERR